MRKKDTSKEKTKSALEASASHYLHADIFSKDSAHITLTASRKKLLKNSIGE